MKRNVKPCEYAPESGRAKECRPISPSSEADAKPVKGAAVQRLMREMTAATSLEVTFEIESTLGQR